jgi:hypothetical protein
MVVGEDKGGVGMVQRRRWHKERKVIFLKAINSPRRKARITGGVILGILILQL